MVVMESMADRRLQNIWSHLSPPVSSIDSESPYSSRLSAPELGRVGEVTSNEEDGEAMASHGRKRFEVECRGANTDREAKLIETLMLSRVRRLCTDASTSADSENHSELRLVACRGESKPLDVAEEENLETRELEKSEETCGESGSSGDGDTEMAESVRSGITSASAVSSSGAASLQSRTQLESKSRGHLTACEFCDIIQGSAPCIKLYEDELCLCILDINPLSFGHSLILPKAHFSCLEATPPQVAAAMCAAVPLISTALLAATRCDSFNMLVNSGVAAGQVIMHTHFHIIPRCKGDGLWKSEGGTRRPMRKVQEAKSLALAVRTKLSSTGGPVMHQEVTPLSLNSAPMQR